MKTFRPSRLKIYAEKYFSSRHFPTRDCRKSRFERQSTSNHLLCKTKRCSSSLFIHSLVLQLQRKSKVTSPTLRIHSFHLNSKCKTTNNHILCSNNHELSVVTIPTSIDDRNVKTRPIQFSDRIEQINVLFESSTRAVVSIKTENSETKIYQFDKKETATEWDIRELDVQIKSNGFYGVGTEKNLVGQQLLEASANEQKLNFYLSNINDQTLSNKRSYSVELPENMGGIEYLSYSTVKHTSLVTLRMQDASLLVIKLADNGGRKRHFCFFG